MAECIQCMSQSVSPYTQKMMRVLLKRLTDEDMETKSNAAFGMGLLCEASTQANEVLPHYNEILAKLEPLLQTQKEGDARMLDNAAGCVSRMIRKAPTHVPVSEVLPRLVELLPLKEDFRENEPVFDMIVSLYQKQDQTVQSLTGQLMPVFQKVLGPPEDQLNDEIKSKVVQLVQFLQKQ